MLEMYSSVLWRPDQGSLPQFRLICALFVGAKNKPAAADTDRAAAHSPQASSQLSEVQPLTIMSIHHTSLITICLILREKPMTLYTSYV